MLVIHPIRFGEEILGTLEVEHHKRHAYGPKDLLAMSTLAGQMATAIHIAELRRPLVLTVGQIGEQVTSLARVADSLRASATALADVSLGMRQGAAELEKFAAGGLQGDGIARQGVAGHDGSGCPGRDGERDRGRWWPPETGSSSATRSPGWWS